MSLSIMSIYEYPLVVRFSVDVGRCTDRWQNQNATQTQQTTLLPLPLLPKGALINMTIAIDNMNMESQNDEAAIATDMDTESPPAADVASSENNENEEPTNNNNNNNQGVRTAATSGENFTVPASAVEPAPASLNCRLMPHGAYTVLPALFATMAWFA